MTGPLVTFDCFTPTNLAIKSNWSWRVIYDVITLRDNKWCIELFSPICPLILPLPQALYWQSGLIDSCGVVYFYWQRIINSTAKHPNLHLRSHVGKNTDWPSSYYTTIILSWSLRSSLLKTKSKCLIRATAPLCFKAEFLLFSKCCALVWGLGVRKQLKNETNLTIIEKFNPALNPVAVFDPAPRPGS